MSTRGRLMLGGVEVSRAKKDNNKKKKKHKKEKRPRDDSEDDERGRAYHQEESPELVVLSGSGRISTSGNTVQGHDGTKFMKDALENGALSPPLTYNTSHVVGKCLHTYVGDFMDKHSEQNVHAHSEQKG